MDPGAEGWQSQNKFRVTVGGAVGATMIREHVSPQRHAELVSASIVQHRPKGGDEKWTLKQVQGDGWG